MITLEKLLRAGKSKIKNPENWCKGKQAKDSRGVGCSIQSDTAVKFCAVGAYGSVLKGGPEEHDLCIEALDLLNNASCLMPDQVYWTIVGLNDRSQYGHAGVMECYDIAIAVAAGAGI